MIAIRKNAARGATRIDWLNSRHTFSFGDYRDPKFDGFRDLRVINEDFVIAGSGFGTHGHRDMEILSYVLEGELTHNDSTGTGSTIRPGEIQRMSAGSGIRHSEANGSKTNGVHFLQIWIEPSTLDLPPSYEQKTLPPITDDAQLDLIASEKGEGAAVTVHQDVRLYRATVKPGAKLDVPLAAGRYAWIQVARGTATVNGQALATGDAAALSDETAVHIEGTTQSELLVFDLV